MYGNIISLICSIIFYGVSLFLLIKYYKVLPQKLMNIIFVIIIFVPYLGVLHFAATSVGFKDWNFLNALPPANVSPFSFTMCLFTLVLPKKIKGVIFRVFSFLVVGMFFAAIITDVLWIMDHKVYHFFRCLDSLSHLCISLFGIYLVLTKQVEVNVKSFIKGFITMFSVVAVMIILNVTCGTAFFGLAFDGRHNIYSMVLTKSPYLSAFLYMTGLAAVLVSSYFVELFVTKKVLENKKSA